VPKLDENYAANIGAYLGATLPVYGLNFLEWWNDRLVPEIETNFRYLEDKIDNWEKYSLAEWAVFLEDAMDIHDRHWKIHWMLNFAQFSATLGMGAVMAEVKGEGDDALVGRLMQSDADHNWDSIKALWDMKEAVKKSEVLSEAFTKTGEEIYEALQATDEGRKFIDEMLYPWQRAFGWLSVWTHEVCFETRFENPAPALDIIREYVESDFDVAAAIKEITDDIAAAEAELFEGVEPGEGYDTLKDACDNLRRMAPLTPDHHFYIDQATNAHVRVVLMQVGKKMVEAGIIDDKEDIVFFRYNEMRYLVGNPEAFDAKALIEERKAERAAAYKIKPRAWIGTATESQLEFPYLDLWGFPERLHLEASEEEDKVTGLACSPGVVEGTAKVVMSVAEFDLIESGDIMVCRMTNPAWTALFTKISGLVTDAGGQSSHPAILSREFKIPSVIGCDVATVKIKTGDRIRVDGTNGEVTILS
jgi:pyruvate,water dikinase